MTNVLSRREAIKKVAILIGGTLALPDVLKAWGNLTVEHTEYLFLPPDGALLAEIAEMIVPATDTPGAKEALVPEFVQKIVADCYDAADRNDFMAALKKVDEYAQQLHRKNFMDCSAPQRLDALRMMEAMYHHQKMENGWMDLKRPIVEGYFTSEIGCTQALRYEPVPGSYDGAFPYKKGDKTWAT